MTFQTNCVTNIKLFIYLFFSAKKCRNRCFIRFLQVSEKKKLFLNPILIKSFLGFLHKCFANLKLTRLLYTIYK